MHTDPSLLAWAKRTNSPGGPSYHPLRNHSLDALSVMAKLWDEAFGPADHARLAREFGLDVQQTGKLLKFLASAHDIGKLTPSFQALDRDRYAFLATVQLPRDDHSASTPEKHGTLSAKILFSFLQANGWAQKTAIAAASAIGGHHGTFIAGESLTETTQIGSLPWRNAQKLLLHRLLSFLGIDRVPQPATSSTPAWVLTAALVTVSDWIASNNDDFPFDERSTDAAEYLQERSAVAESALRRLGWLPRSQSVAFSGFDHVFGIEEPSSLQQTLLNLANLSGEPGLFIVESPMGDGKTEAAFAAAEVLRSQLHLRGLYCALPTQATGEQMFLRLARMLEHRGSVEPQLIALLHGQASLSVEYARLRLEGREYMTMLAVGGETADEPAVVSADWFASAKRGLLTPYGAGTVDQALLSVIGSRHFFVRLLGLWGKTVIIDEVHAYDAYVTRILERLLLWAARIGSPVILLSATLPKKTRVALIQAYRDGTALRPVALDRAPSIKTPIPFQNSDEEPSGLLTGCPYPRVTALDRQGCRIHPTVPRAQPKTVALRFVDQKECVASLVEALAAGGNAAFLCNTVGSACRWYQQLLPFFGPDLELIHSRFLLKDRAGKLDRLLSRVAKGTSRPARSVTLSTQIIEQSLDLDFDLLITELAPVDLVLQRMGRLHRHNRALHPSFLQPSTWIIEPETKNGLPSFGSSVRIYEEHVLLRTWLRLQSTQVIGIPHEIDSLVESVYGDNVAVPANDSRLGRLWHTTLDQMNRKMEDDRSNAGSMYIRGPQSVLSRLVSPSADAEPVIAKTRLFQPSLSLIALYCHDLDGWSFDPGGADVVDPRVAPSLSMTKRLLQHSVNLPIYPADQDKLNDLTPLPPLWKKKAVLSRMELLLLDKDRIGKVGSLRLGLDQSLGLLRI